MPKHIALCERERIIALHQHLFIINIVLGNQKSSCVFYKPISINIFKLVMIDGICFYFFYESILILIDKILDISLAIIFKNNCKWTPTIQ